MLNSDFGAATKKYGLWKRRSMHTQGPALSGSSDNIEEDRLIRDGESDFEG
jgi:hypothetical protein